MENFRSKDVLIFSVLILLSFNAFAQGLENEEIISRDGNCFSIGSGNSETPISCPTEEFNSRILDEEQKSASIDRFKSFEQSEVAQQLRDALSTGRSSIKDQSPEFRRGSAFVKDGRYRTRLVFFNDRGFPNKYSSGAGYYIQNGDSVEVMDSIFESQWDEIISSQLVGLNYEEFSPIIKSVTDKFVTVILFLDNSAQLESIVAGKSIKSINHIGSPEIQYEEIGR